MTTTHFLAAAVLAASLATAGCSSLATAKAGAALTQPAAPALTFTLPAGWKATPVGDTLHLDMSHDNDVIIRLVPAAAAPADALPTIPQAISAEVRDFKPTSIKDITLAGQPAKHVFGTGIEADDGDPSVTEVFAFTVAKKIYIACVHGESTDAQRLRPAVLKTLDSAQPR